MKYPFSKSFQKKLASLYIQKGSLLVAEDVVKPEYFESPSISRIVEASSRLYKEYGGVLTFPLVGEALRKEVGSNGNLPKLLNVLDSLKVEVSETEGKMLQKEAISFARHQAFKLALRETVDLLRNDDQAAIEQVWVRAFSLGKNTSYGLGDFFFSSLPKRIRERMKRPDIVKSLIPGLDQSLSDGGFARKELNVFLGLPSAGKSFALDHMAKVSILQKLKVVVYSLEMSALRVMSRLDASFSGLMILELRNSVKELSKRVGKYGSMYGDSLLVKEFSAGRTSVSMLSAHLTSLKLSGFVPDVVVIDYINLLSSPESYDNRYQDLGQIYIDLRGLAQDYNVFCFTAAQANRGGWDTDLIRMKDIAESFQGAMHADVIISLNRTDEEAQREAIRLYIVKDRNGLDKVVIPGYTNFKRGCFWKRA